MSAGTVTLLPTALKFDGREAIAIAIDDDQEDDTGLDEVVVTHLDEDLPSSPEKLSPGDIIDSSPLDPWSSRGGERGSAKETTADRINAEWRRLKYQRNNSNREFGGAPTQSPPGSSGPVGVISYQPKATKVLSEADVILQPSQVEEMLGQNSLLLSYGGDKDGAAAATTTGASPSASRIEKKNSFSSSSSSFHITGSMAEQTYLNRQDLSRPLIPKRSGIWGGFMSCINPVFSILRKEKRGHVGGREDDWEIPFADIRELEFIGSGGQGAVFVGEYLGEKCAVKKVKDVKYCQEAMRMRKLNHPNVVKFRGVCTKPPCYCLILEFCPGGTLYDYIRLELEILPPQVVSWARQIASGMQYLHSKKIIHRDLKSLNILLWDNNTLKIADFGVSRQIGEVSTKMTFVGTVGWMSPEIIRHELCSEKVDIWSYGVLLWELLMQERPYSNIGTSAIIWGVGSSSLHLPIPTSCPVGLKVLLEMCWQPKPKNRPSFRQILMHLDLAAGAFLTIPPDTYLMTQESWRAEIEIFLRKLSSDGIPKDSELIHQREEELRHAQDVRVMYEEKLKSADTLYKKLRTCKNQIDAKELELQRREKKLNDVAFKVKRHSEAGDFPFLRDTPTLDQLSSDTSDNEDTNISTNHHHHHPAGAAVANGNKTTPLERVFNTDSGTPTSGGRRKIWRRKRRQSNSKDEKPKDSGFLDKVQAGDLLTRRQSLTPLRNLTPNSPRLVVECDPVTPTQDDNTELLEIDGLSRDSTPNPKNPNSNNLAISSFNESLSPVEVSELIDSVRASCSRHRRNLSSGSIRVHRRQGSNGSVSSCMSQPHSSSKLSGHLHSGSNLNDGTDVVSGASQRGSNSNIPYSKVDTSSGSESTNEESKKPDNIAPTQSSLNIDGSTTERGNQEIIQPLVARDIYSNESSLDTHESDSEGHEADGESTSEGYENKFSGTEPNETTESNFESSVASPSQDEMTSSSTPDIMESNLLSDLIQDIHGSSYENQTTPRATPHHQIEATTGSSYENQTTPRATPHHQLEATTTRHQKQQKSPLSELEHHSSLSSEEDLTRKLTTIDPGSACLTIPAHIRRQSLETQDNDGSLTPTAAKPRINSMTTIVRTFFENISSKSRRHESHYNTAELEDSGFQSPQAGVSGDV